MAKKRIQVTLTNEMNERLEKESKEKGLSKTAIVILGLEEYFKKTNEENEK